MIAGRIGLAGDGKAPAPAFGQNGAVPGGKAPGQRGEERVLGADGDMNRGPDGSWWGLGWIVLAEYLAQEGLPGALVAEQDAKEMAAELLWGALEQLVQLCRFTLVEDLAGLLDGVVGLAPGEPMGLGWHGAGQLIAALEMAVSAVEKDVQTKFAARGREPGVLGDGWVFCLGCCLGLSGGGGGGVEQGVLWAGSGAD